jgi:hypothetical protein
MNDDRDPLLHDLFREPPRLERSDDFLQQTARRVERDTRRRRLLRLGAEIAVLVVAWLLAEPLHALATELMPWIMASLVDTGDGMLSQLLAPMNSVAGVIALLVLLTGAAYRRLFRSN